MAKEDDTIDAYEPPYTMTDSEIISALMDTIESVGGHIPRTAQIAEKMLSDLSDWNFLLVLFERLKIDDQIRFLENLRECVASDIPVDTPAPT